MRPKLSGKLVWDLSKSNPITRSSVYKRDKVTVIALVKDIKNSTRVSGVFTIRKKAGIYIYELVEVSII